jgi:tRNA U34 5-carboxymethylaminomethyl modifying GTPase MnmE/TrmE
VLVAAREAMSVEVLELTPPGPGGVSVIRVRGAGALSAVRELAPRLRSQLDAPQLVRLRLDGEDLDEAIACAPAPDEIELHVHGSPPLVKRIVEHLRRASQASDADDARSSTGSMSAIDGCTTHDSTVAARTVARLTVESRAAALLARAESDSGARILLDQCGGALRTELCDLARASAAARASALDAMLERGRVARFALEPTDVVIAGRVNAGKSTLFNVLLGEERTIVAAEEGTTRDAVTERALLGAYPVRLTDTAGEREIGNSSGSDVLERAGQDRARRARAEAELVLWLVRADADVSARSRAEHDSATTRAGADLNHGRFVILHTQIDRVLEEQRARFAGAISAARDPERARERVREVFRGALELPVEPWFPGSAVPFDDELTSGLRALALDASEDAWMRAIAALIGERYISDAASARTSD